MNLVRVGVRAARRMGRTLQRRLLTPTVPEVSLRYFGPWERLKLQRMLHWHQGEFDPRHVMWKGGQEEVRTLRPFLTDPALLPQPPRLVMELGCGSGRSALWLRRAMRWETTRWLLVDGHAPVFGAVEDSKESLTTSQGGFAIDTPTALTFYSDFDLTDRLLCSNGMSRYTLIDLRTEARPPSEWRGGQDPPVQVDLLYSFSAVGLHFDPTWVMNQYGLHDVLAPGALVIFGTRTSTHPDFRRVNWPRFLACGYERLRVVRGDKDYVLCRRMVGVGVTEHLDQEQVEQTL